MDTPVSVRPTDVDLRNGAEPASPELDGHALAKMCRGKINRLFRRMIAQLELAVEHGKNATTAIVQLAAVLGVVKHLRLRHSSFEWLPHGETLIDTNRQLDFFLKTARLLYAPSCRLASIALAEHDEHEFDELTAVRGLLAWLAVDSGLDTPSVLKQALYEPDITREKLTEIGYFVPVITECASDEFATAMLTSITCEQKNENTTRAAYHVKWARQLLRAAENHQLKPSPIALGNMAVPLKVRGAQFSIVVAVEVNKSGLLDLDTGEAKYYATGFLSKIQSLCAQHSS